MFRFALVPLLCIGGCVPVETLPVEPISYTCPGPCGDRCVCVDPKDCQSQTCSTKPPPYPVPKTEYESAWEMVNSGVTTYVVVGGKDAHLAPEFAYRVDSLPGIEPGAYSCVILDGRPVMNRIRGGRYEYKSTCNGNSCTTERVWVPNGTGAAVPTGPTTVFASPCANGNCGLQPAKSRR